MLPCNGKIPYGNGVLFSFPGTNGPRSLSISIHHLLPAPPSLLSPNIFNHTPSSHTSPTIPTRAQPHHLTLISAFLIFHTSSTGIQYNTHTKNKRSYRHHGTTSKRRGIFLARRLELSSSSLIKYSSSTGRQ